MPFRLRVHQKKQKSPPSANMSTPIPAPIPPFAPLLNPDDGGPAVADDVEIVPAAVTEALMLELELMIALTLMSPEGEFDIDDDRDEKVEASEEIEDEDTVAGRRTRNPGLDRSPLLWLKTGEVILNRRTYFALMVKFPSGIEMVQAKLPGDLRSIPVVTR